MATKLRKQTKKEIEVTIQKNTHTLFPHGYKVHSANKEIIFLEFYESQQFNKKRNIQIQGTFALNKSMAKAMAEEILKDLEKV